MDGTTIAEAQNAVSDAIATVAVQERLTADEEIERVLDQAEARLDDAQRAAEAIAQSTIIAEQATRFDAFKQEIREWLGRLETEVQQIPEMNRRLSETEATLTALALSSIQANPSLSIQPTLSETQQAVEQITTTLPASLSESVVVESPEAPTRKVKRRFL